MLAHQLPLERLEPVIHRRHHRLVRLALLDLLVDALLDEDALQRAVMQFVLQLLLAQFQFALQDGRPAASVFSRNTSLTVSSTGRLSLMTTMRLAMVTSQSVNA